jgi:hypothetical protein
MVQRTLLAFGAPVIIVYAPAAWWTDAASVRPQTLLAYLMITIVW